MFVTWIYFLLCGPTILLGHELKLIHVVFSHKFYAPVQSNVNNSNDGFPEKMNYQFFLEQTDDMVNSAKMDMFNLGVFLRQRYDKFLGDIYFPEIMKMRTSQYVLSMISGQLVNAGLWPPAQSQQWNEELDWQPVVSEYVQAERDTLLLGTLCPSFLHEEELVYQHESSSSLMTAHKPLFDHISKHHRSTIKRPSDVALFYSCLETKADQNETLPNWVEKIFPDGDMKNVTLLSFDMLSRTALQKQLNGGTLLKAIINDTLEHQINNSTKRLKIAMYSGEERNLIGIMQSMGVWSPHILSPASSLLFEIYANSTTKKYTVKMIFHTGVENDTIDLNLPDCDEFCPIDKFKKYLQLVLPIDDEKSLCQKKPTDKHNTHANGNSTSVSINYCIVLIVLIHFMILL